MKTDRCFERVLPVAGAETRGRAIIPLENGILFANKERLCLDRDHEIKRSRAGQVLLQCFIDAAQLWCMHGKISCCPGLFSLKNILHYCPNNKKKSGSTGSAVGVKEKTEELFSGYVLFLVEITLFLMLSTPEGMAGQTSKYAILIH
jgi:hypothetical protein